VRRVERARRSFNERGSYSRRVSQDRPAAAAPILDFRMRGPHHPAQGRATDQDPVRRSLSVETVIGIALIVISALEIVWITRTVQANTPR
jgi:hypothetical protein